MFLIVLQYCKPNLSWRLQEFFKMDQESDKDIRVKGGGNSCLQQLEPSINSE